MEEEEHENWCQNPHYAKIGKNWHWCQFWHYANFGINFGIGAKIGISANFGIGTDFGIGTNFGIGLVQILAGKIGTGANFGTLATSCEIPSLLLFDFFLFFFPFLPSLSNAF